MRPFLLLAFVTIVGAQTPPNWTQQFPQTNPPARYDHAIAYDSAHAQVVLFGGFDPQGEVLGDTWVWDGSDWTQKFPQTSPTAARSQFGMAYDSAHSQIVVFGGYGGPEDGFFFALPDTWVWDGTTWTEKCFQCGPPGRNLLAMAYDSTHGQVVLFGGQGAGSKLLNDTWAWDGSKWMQQNPQTSPSPRCGHVMAYDFARGQVVMFGGSGVQSVGSLNETWVWDGSNWSQKHPQSSPPATSYEIAYDSAHDQVVLFGESGTWVWDGSNWTQESPQSIPPKRYGHAMAYDSGHDQVVLFGGATTNGTGGLADTWTWQNPAAVAQPIISNVVSASSFGGFSSVAPGSWVEIYGSNLASDTRGWAGADFSGNNAPTSLDGVSVSIGGEAAFVDYISPTQVNAQLPSAIAAGAMLPLTLTSGGVTSAPYSLAVNPTQPGLLASAQFKIGANQYVVAQHSDGAYVLPTGSIAGANSRPATPGETIVMYGIGFGAVTPSIPAGEIVTQTNQLSSNMQIYFGGTSALVPYAGLAPGLVGLYQFNVMVPDVTASNPVPITFSLEGVAGTQTLVTSVQE